MLAPELEVGVSVAQLLPKLGLCRCEPSAQGPGAANRGRPFSKASSLFHCVFPLRNHPSPSPSRSTPLGAPLRGEGGSETGSSRLFHTVPRGITPHPPLREAPPWGSPPGRGGSYTRLHSRAPNMRIAGDGLLLPSGRGKVRYSPSCSLGASPLHWLPGTGLPLHSIFGPDPAACNTRTAGELPTSLEASVSRILRSLSPRNSPTATGFPTLSPEGRG